MRELLDKQLPNAKILFDLRELLNDSSPIELEEGVAEVTDRTPLAVIAKGFHCYEFDIEWGEHFRTLVAIGDVTVTDAGAVEAGLCFATMIYRINGELITVDFARRWP